MRTAFKTSFRGIKHALEFNKDNDEELEDDEEAHYSLENEQMPPLRVHYNYFLKNNFLFCSYFVTHRKRRLKRNEALRRVIGKVSRLAALLHRRTIFKER